MIRIKHASICKHTESNSPIKFSSSYELFQSWRTLQNGLKLNSRCISDERGTNLRWLYGVIKIQDFGFALTCSAIGPSRHPQPIRRKTKTNHDVVVRVFPHFLHFASFYFEFSLVNDEMNHRFEWMFWLF